MNEQEYDRLLGIETTVTQNGSLHVVQQYYPYEPTSYRALDALFHEYEWTNGDHLVDFGCGKGRLLFYLHYYIGISSTGVEIDTKYYQEAEVNLLRYQDKNKSKSDGIYLNRSSAEAYEVHMRDNRFYFFNPFAAHIFKKIVERILASVKQHPRSVDLILYYPSADYLQFLDTHTPFERLTEIRVPGWYEQNVNERFLIYRL